jgi:hypothetical protein
LSNHRKAVPVSRNVLFGEPHRLLVDAHGAAVHDHRHAAGVAAALAVSQNAAVQDIDIAELQRRLKEEGAVYQYGLQYQAEALAVIRRRYAPPQRKGPAPWDLPTRD